MQSQSTNMIHASVAGFYKLEATNKTTGEKRLLADWFPNLITDNGLNKMGTNNVLFNCMVGSGQTAPQVTDVAMQALIGSTSSSQSIITNTQSTAPYYGSIIKTFRFSPGAAVGNLSEVGIGDSPTSLFSRSLILDGLGQPTTITVIADEYLDVSYELRTYVPTVDQFATIYLGTTPITCTIRAASATTPQYWAYTGSSISLYSSNNTILFSGPIGNTVTSDPSGSTAYMSATTNAYANGSHTKSFYGVWDLEAANFGAGGIQSLKFVTTIGAYQIGFSPAISKDNTKTLRLDFGVSWARAV